MWLIYSYFPLTLCKSQWSVSVTPSKGTQVFKLAIHDGFAVWGHKKPKLGTLSEPVGMSWEQLAEKNFWAQLPSTVYTEFPVLRQKCLDRHQVDMPTNYRVLQCFPTDSRIYPEVHEIWVRRSLTVLSWDVKGKQGSLCKYSHSLNRKLAPCKRTNHNIC